MSARTIPQLLDERVHKTPDALAFLSGGERTTWGELGARAEALALAFAEAGVRPGDVVAVMGPTTGEWVTVDLGVLCAGGVSMGIYSTLTPSQVAHQLNDSGARIAVAGSAAELETLRQAQAQAKTLERIVGWGSASAGCDAADDYRALLARGRALRDSGGDEEIARLKASRGPEDTALLIYTSGTTGPPKGAMLSHWNCVFEVKTCEPILPAGMDRDVTVSFLPMAHVAEHVIGAFGRMNTGMSTSYVGSLESEHILAALKQTRPTIFGAVPQVFERANAKLRARVAAAPRHRRTLFAWAERVGREVAAMKQTGGRPRLALAVQHAVADRLVFKKIRDSFGGRVQYFISGAAPIDKDILVLFYSFGLHVLEVYGLTECSGIATLNRHVDFRFGSVGKPIPGLEVKLASDGEILLRGDSVFQGYRNQPEATALAIDADRWLHTGDIGALDADGFLRIVDRKKNLIVTSGGKNVAPAAIEALLAGEPVLGPVLIVGDRRPFITAVVSVNLDAARAAAGRPAATIAELARDARVRGLVRAALERSNRHLARYEQVRRFIVLDREVNVDSGEMTPTLKMKRSLVAERCGAHIDALYAVSPPRDVEELARAR
jgi:long-chain acyl-CoA synthetase